MRRTNNRPEDAKICPLLDGQKCIKGDCEIYNDLINRCNISVIAYNMYRLSDVMNRQLADYDRSKL
jgi:hypothetical protein